MMQLETLTACPICKSERIEPTTSNALRCLDCGQAFGNPRLDDTSAWQYYAGEYRNHMNDTRKGVTEDIPDVQRQRERARVQYGLIEPYVASVRTMLEIGCSLGYLMDQFNIYQDAECVGIEADVRYHKADPASNFKLYTDISELEPRRFDLIALSHVVEHMNHPHWYLAYLANYHAHDKTLMMIEVPNLEVLTETITLNHPFGFTRETLNNLMARIGFVPVFFKKHGLGADKEFYLLGVYKRA